MNRVFRSPVFWLIICSVLPLWALLVRGLPVTHDGIDHVARIANFYQSLKEGNLIPRWAANLNWGYGHPILMFLYPLPSYFASLFRLFGMSFVDSTKMVLAVSMVASGLCMYLWLATAYGKRTGFIGGLLYVFAPYRFVDLYVRGALGEHVAFVFPPLVLYFLYKLAHSFEWHGRVLQGVGVAVSTALLILSHNAIAIMFMPIIGVYMVYLFFFETKQKWFFGIISVAAVLAGFGLCAFFWIPAFFEGKYTLRDIVTAGDTVSRFVPWSWFLYSPWNYGQGDTLTKSLGIAQWVGVIAAMVALWKTKKQHIRIVLISSLIILLFSFFIMTSLSGRIWEAVTLLQKFQFPWRFLSVSVFAAAALGGIAFRHSKKLYIILYAFFIILMTCWMWHPKAYVVHDESFYSGIYMSTTDTGESSPIWSVRFMEHTAAAPLQVIDGSAIITNGYRSSTIHEYTVTVSKPTLFVENTVYFPNWIIYIDGSATAIQYQNPNYRGLMTFQVAPGIHTVRVVFENTRLRAMSEKISIVTLVIIGLMGFGVIIWPKKI
jgi:hypothetical protein